MKKGQFVNVYEDPVTETKLEGKAKLIRKYTDYTGGEQWLVKFEDGSMVSRFIKV